MTCNECKECPECDEEYTWTVSIAWECWGCYDCAPKKECCTPNIIWWDCITVTEDDAWVITISTECNPEILSSDGTVTVTKTHDDIDHWDLSVADSDHLVWACDADKTPSTLDQKLIWTDGITITPICSDNWKIQIWFDHSTINCIDNKVAADSWCNPWYLWDIISINSSLIQWGVNWCNYVITDKEQPSYYAKIYLKTTITESLPKWAVGSFDFKSQSFWTDYVHWLTTSDWFIWITKKWLYNVWFSWSLECWAWVHWIRIQLYAWTWSNKRTIIESRYSWPVWLQPFEFPWYDLNYVSDVRVYWWAESSASANVSKKEFKIDAPIITEKTDVQWVSWKSASLWAYISRMPVWGSTIMELSPWDTIYLWAKLQTEIDYSWDLLAKAGITSWVFSLLARNDNEVNSWWECWLTIYADLIHPLV